jgi:phosphatidylserine/phosphatidylglycerophosphate/cardiolipin synthase-like enzyme
MSAGDRRAHKLASRLVSRQDRGSALPWLLLALAVIATLVIFVAALMLTWNTTTTPQEASTFASLSVTPSAASTASPTLSSRWPVYFTDPKYPDKAADHKPSLDAKLTAFIDEAQSSVDMAIYQLDLPNVTQAMIDAKKRGATVRVVTDIDILKDSKENPSFKKLEAAGIPVVGGNSNAIMHDKFVVVDHAAVWTGSWNFTTNDTYRYNNNAIVIRSPELAANYTTAFEKMFVDNDFGPAKKPGGTVADLTIDGIHVENYFSAEDRPADKIVARLQEARYSIDFMAYSFTYEGMGQAIRDAAESGVKVQGVIETTGAKTASGQYNKFKAAGLDVLLDGNPYLMHHKVFIIDDQTVVMGSFNFSENANRENDENLLIIDNPEIAQSYLAEFQRVYQRAQAAQK